jgi:hypothetical protein
MRACVKSNAAANKLARAATDSVSRLADLAATGAKDAASCLHETAVQTTQLLAAMCDRQPDIFSAIAQEERFWPVLYGPHRELKEMVDKLIKKLKVGVKTGLNLESGKTFSWNVPANAVAYSVYQLAQSLRRAPMREWSYRDFYAGVTAGIGGVSSEDPSYRKRWENLEAWGQTGPGRQLPPLSTGAAKEWAKATPKLFRLAYGDNFDEHPWLQGLRKSVEAHAKPRHADSTRPGDIKQAMLKAVKQAWSSIASLG